MEQSPALTQLNKTDSTTTKSLESHELLTRLTQSKNKITFNEIEQLIGNIDPTQLLEFIEGVCNFKDISNERKAMVFNVLYFKYSDGLLPLNPSARHCIAALCEYYNLIADFKTTSDNTDPAMINKRSSEIVAKHTTTYAPDTIQRGLSNHPFSLNPFEVYSICARLGIGNIH